MHRILLPLLLFAASPSFAQEKKADAPPDTSYTLQSLDAELTRLGASTALIVPSQAVDEFPVWSPDGSRLAANVAGVWYSVRLDSLALVGATWRGDLPLGALQSGESVAETPEATAWQEAANFAPRSIRTEGGTSVELRQEGMSTAFVITRTDAEPETLWTSGFENCHSLTLSSDERYVAFICEMNGVFAYRLDQDGM